MALARHGAVVEMVTRRVAPPERQTRKGPEPLGYGGARSRPVGATARATRALDEATVPMQPIPNAVWHLRARKNSTKGRPSEWSISLDTLSPRCTRNRSFSKEPPWT